MKEPHLLSKGGWSADGGDGGAQSGDARREGRLGVQVQCRDSSSFIIIIKIIIIAKTEAITNTREPSWSACTGCRHPSAPLLIVIIMLRERAVLKCRCRIYCHCCLGGP